MTKAVAQNTAAAAHAEAAAFALSPDMARLRLEYIARCKRNSDTFDRLEACPKDAPDWKSINTARSAALGALRDVEHQIHETPIRTLADALFILRLHVKLNGTCESLVTHRDPEEAALINAIRVINGLVIDDTSVADSPDDNDHWLSQAPYADAHDVGLVAAE